MKAFHLSLASAFLLAGALAQAATVSGTVTDKTTNKPSSGDLVELIDVQAGMSAAAKATTDASGRYSLNEPGSGPYLIRATHQGGQYFIAAPQGNGPGDISVFDVAAKVEGVSIEADVLEVEADAGQLKITERYFVHNTSQPPRTQYNPAHGFEFVLPEGAVVDGSAARRPAGLPTNTSLKPAAGKNRFQFDFPIQPDEGEKDTLFQISYHLPYNGSYTFKTQLLLPADNVAVLLPKSFVFKAGSGAKFQSVPQDPGIQTMLMKNVASGTALEFTVSGTGSMPREQQQAGGQQAGGQQGGMEGAPQGAQPNQPGGGIGEPISTPDPLSKYKWWILGGVGLLLAAAAAFLLRKPAVSSGSAPAGVAPAAVAAPVQLAPAPAGGNASLLNVLKEELFSLESERLSGTIGPEEYAEQKAALETVLKRALSRK